jgi:phenylalanine-4-hydroxylase
MKSNAISTNNAAVAALPKHLLQFAVDQRYDDYTPVDHAVWRFIMRQNTYFLKEYAHKLYFQGLLETGISFDRIPRIDEMNEILGKIGWGAVAVDGFIPPAAFMEFQAYRVLVIACDMRQINHIEYTPAPGHRARAAGHAPIIVDREYADYLQRFGEVGAKAMSSKKDFELYEAIRHLSILKEQPNPDPKSSRTRRNSSKNARRISAIHRRWRFFRGCIGGRSSTASSARSRTRRSTAPACSPRSVNQ